MTVATCSIQPCILWNIPAVYFALGCVLILLALLARYVVKFLLSVVAVVLRWQGKQAWNARLKRELLVPTTWFLRTGLVLGAYIVLLNQPVGSTEVTTVPFYLFAVVFCICWMWWSFVFLAAVSRLIVEEYELADRRKHQVKQSAMTSASQPTLEYKINASMLAYVNQHEANLRSSRTTALSQVLLIFRVMILVVVAALACSVLQISFTNILNDTNIWWLPILLALAPHFRSIYLGTLLTFLFTDDEWTTVQAGNVCSVENQDHFAEETSLARARLTRIEDGATVFAPLNFIFDRGAQTEGQRISATRLRFELELRDGLSVEQLAMCRLKVETLLTSLSTSLSLSFIHYSAPTRTLLIVATAMSAPLAIEQLKGDVHLGLVDALRTYLQPGSSPSKVMDDDLDDIFVLNFPEIAPSSDSSEFDYSLLQYRDRGIQVY